MERSTESQLIERCQQGELNQFGVLYDTYIKKIYDFIYYKTHHQQTAEDLTSHTFLKALRSINSFSNTAGTFQAWLYQIARNTVIDHYRTQKATVNLEDAWDLHDNTDIVRDTDTALKLETVQAALQQLSSEQRDIVLLRVWSGLSYAEIAAIVGKTEDSCKVSFSRTIKKLREQNALLALLLFMISIVR